MPNMERIHEMAEDNKYDLEELVTYYHKNLNREAFYYLENKGIRQETIDKFRLGFESGKIGFYIRENSLAEYFEDRIIVPITDAKGAVVDLVGRSFDQREPLYKSLYGVDEFLYNEQVLKDSEEVILCSDILDVLTLTQVDLPAVCMPNTLLFKETFSEKFAGKRVFICLANDETGRRESVRIESILKEQAKELFTVHLPEKIRTINDLFVKRSGRSSSSGKF
ncbi:hypothetical protein N6H14_30695 [Paenibacillus sp. CC-CFT747]|nr:hypothetical protein N6H14_30695 [Paenibacillus sp. CC-CFT747]